MTMINNHLNQFVDILGLDQNQIRLDQINYNGSRDVYQLLNNHYFKIKKYYRMKIHAYFGEYFNENEAIQIYSHLVNFYRQEKKKKPDLKFEQAIQDWRDRYLTQFKLHFKSQQIDEEYRLTVRIKQFFFSFFQFLKK